jgi:hypothetical protein
VQCDMGGLNRLTGRDSWPGEPDVLTLLNPLFREIDPSPLALGYGIVPPLSKMLRLATSS